MTQVDGKRLAARIPALGAPAGIFGDPEVALALFETSASLAVVLDAEGRMVRCNETFLKTIGLHREEVEGHYPWDHMPDPEEAAGLKALFQRRGIAGFPRLMEGSWQMPRGGRRHWLWSNTPIHDADGTPSLLVMVAVDISERVAAEQAQTRANRALRVLSAFNEALVRVAQEATLLDTACRVPVEIGGYAFAWVGLKIEDADKSIRPVARAGRESGYLSAVRLSWGDDEVGEAPCGRAVRTKRAVAIREIGTDANCETFRREAARRGFASLLVLPLLDGEEAFGLLAVYAREPGAFDEEEVRLFSELANDLAYGLVSIRSRRKQQQAEAALREKDEWLGRIVETMPAGLIALDLQGRLTLANPRAEEMLDLSPSDVGKTRFEMSSWDLLGPDGGPLSFRDDPFLRAVATGEPVHNLEAIARLRDGHSLSVSINAAPLHDLAGRPSGVVMSVADITPIREAEKELHESLGQLRKAVDGIIHTLGSAVESRDPYTAGHQRRVANLARAIALRMGLSRDQVDTIHMAAAVHDIGKISVPAEILSRPGKLNRPEINLIRLHPATGFSVLSPIELPWPIAGVVLQHHERLDGSGYPGGLAADQISREARILAVADVVEAMASHRPYREALGLEAALAEIREGGGLRYDADVVTACLDLFAQGRFDFDRDAEDG